MQSHIYPTPPSQLATHDPLSPSSAPVDGGDQRSDSPGKAKSVLGRVKNKARKLRDKIKAATSTHKDGEPENQADVDHTQEIEDEEEETSDDVDVGDQTRYQQLQSIGALGEQHGDGSELRTESEVQRGTTDPRSKSQEERPAFDQDARNLDEVNTGTPACGTDERTIDMNDAPSNTYKSAGPPDTLQAVPTEYRSYVPDVATDDRYKSNSSLTDETSGVEGCPRDVAMDDVENKVSEPEYAEDDTKGKDLEPDSFGLPGAGEGVDRSAASDIQASPRNPDTIKAGVNAVFPDDLGKPNPAFGNDSPTSDKIGILNEQSSDNTDKRENIVGMPVPDCEESLGSAAVNERADYTPLKENDGRTEDFPSPEQGVGTPVDTLQDETPASTLQAVQYPKDTRALETSDKPSYENKDATPNAGAVDAEPTYDVSAADNVEEMDRQMPPKSPEGAVASDLGNLNLDSNTSADAGENYYDPGPLVSDTKQDISAVDEDKPQPGSLTEYATGTFQGLKNTVASKIGYSSSQSPDQGSAATVEDGEDTRPVEIETGKSSPGTFERLKNTVASKIGYDSSESPDQAGAAATEGEEEAGSVAREPSKEADEGSAKGGMQGLKDTLASKLGYGNSEAPETVEQGDEGTKLVENDPKVADSYENKGEDAVEGKEEGGEGKNYTQKVLETAKDYVGSKVGSYGGDNSSSNNMSSTEEDRSSPSTTTTTAHAEAVVVQPPASPGIFGRVTNAFSSYLGIQHPAPPQEHHDTPAAAAPLHSE